MAEKVLKGGQQKRAKSPPLPSRMAQSIFLEELCEKFLRQILCVLWPVSLSPHKRVERMPVRAAQLFQRFGRIRRVIVTRFQHHAPMRGRKPMLTRRLALSRAVLGHVTRMCFLRSAGNASFYGCHFTESFVFARRCDILSRWNLL